MELLGLMVELQATNDLVIDGVALEREQLLRAMRGWMIERQASRAKILGAWRSIGLREWGLRISGEWNTGCKGGWCESIGNRGIKLSFPFTASPIYHVMAMNFSPIGGLQSPTAMAPSS